MVAHARFRTLIQPLPGSYGGRMCRIKKQFSEEIGNAHSWVLSHGNRATATCRSYGIAHPRGSP
eukprot:m.492882 g.492882  ORF g.492882 m.492882 type:complete len:64 (+) comp21789_c0_seq2:2240-2431(+)